jgi:hypothetical protein
MWDKLLAIFNFRDLKTITNNAKIRLGHFLFFLRFASVQNCETYPPVRGKNKQALQKQSCLCMLYEHETTNI